MLHVTDEQTGSQRGERTFPKGQRCSAGGWIFWVGGIEPRGIGYLEAISRQLASGIPLRTKRWHLYIEVSADTQQKYQT